MGQGINQGWIHDINCQPIIVRKQKAHKRHDIAKLARDMARNGKSMLPALADKLGVTVSSLEAIGVGYKQGAYSFPEVDGRGKVIGITYRTESGRKFCEPGSRRGVIVPNRHLPGTVLLAVEGASDVAACLSAGYNAVGRPSSSGGLDHLVGIAHRRYAAWNVIVMGERDWKPDAKCGGCGNCRLCWPGKWGAMQAVTYLKANRIKAVAVLPPPEFKDCREMWVRTKQVKWEAIQ